MAQKILILSSVINLMAIKIFSTFALYQFFAVLDYSANLKDIDMKPFQMVSLLNFNHFEYKERQNRFINNQVRRQKIRNRSQVV